MKKILLLLTLLVSAPMLFAQAGGKGSKGKAATDTTVLVSYTCPMHPDEVSDHPGKCSKCGMDLTASKKEQMKKEVMKMYTCPMHPGVSSHSPGSCPKCGMQLVEKKGVKKGKKNKADK